MSRIETGPRIHPSTLPRFLQMSGGVLIGAAGRLVAATGTLPVGVSRKILSFLLEKR